MTATARESLSPTARQLLVVAERLFAEHGIAGVSLRQIAAEAGSSNNSAVRYHFGTKDDLLRAIFAFRLPELLRRRALLRARVHPDDVRGHFEAHVLPLLELAEDPDSSYVSFVEQLLRAGDVHVFAGQDFVLRSHDELVTDLGPLLDHLPEPARTLRIQHVQVLSLHAAAERERALRRDETVVPFGLFVSALVDGFTGFLTAPASASTTSILSRAQPAHGPTG